MVAKKLWIGIGVGVAVAALGAGVAVVAVVATSAAADDGISLTSKVDCSATDRTTSTVTWTLENSRETPAAIDGLAGPGSLDLLTSPIGQEIPAAKAGKPGTTTFTQSVTGTASAAIAITTSWSGSDAQQTTRATATGVDCRPSVAVGTLTATQPSCTSSDPGHDGTLLITGGSPDVRYAVSAGGGTPVVVDPGTPYTVIVETNSVTAVVTPSTDDGQKLGGYHPRDWTVTFTAVDPHCS
ncbi:hypothetical protein [Leifsonia sp. TF02-11]|uniref:hypothetical protein n=1 Tax=Leifsonia sp. TF02-11 TaxID=2815212 RepID=UPI001AA0DD0B|nr:hypothetical protein [Leifsonia sp. TF02-11]MBO1737793.1 hypothetical protein [Leifsonia sp. TF02-11]